jgi:hypothetical protein
MHRFRSRFYLVASLCAGLFGAGSVPAFGQSIEVDPGDEIEAIFKDQEAVVNIVEMLKFRARPFMDGVLKGEVKMLQYGIPYVIEATFKTDPQEERLGIQLDWSTTGAAVDELVMVRVREGEKTFYRADKMIILELPAIGN